MDVEGTVASEKLENDSLNPFGWYWRDMLTDQTNTLQEYGR